MVKYIKCLKCCKKYEYGKEKNGGKHTITCHSMKIREIGWCSKNNKSKKDNEQRMS